MPESADKLDETVDAKPYEPPQPRRSRRTLAICVTAGVLLIGTAAALAYRHSRSGQSRITNPIQFPKWHEIFCEVGPTDWSKEVDGLSCKLVVTPLPVGLVHTAVRVRNGGKQPVIMFADEWLIRARGPAVYQNCMPVPPKLPRTEPMIILPGEDCEVRKLGLGSYGYSYNLGVGKSDLFAIYDLRQTGCPPSFANGLPRNLPQGQIEKLENERRKSPGLPNPVIWNGALETRPVLVTVKLFPKLPPQEVSAFSCGQTRIAIGMARAEVHGAIVQRRQEAGEGYSFSDYDAREYRATLWKFTYGPSDYGAGRYDDITLTFDGERVAKILVVSNNVP